MSLSIRKTHRIMGVLLVLPFLAWSATGLFFFIKPGYADAYSQLKAKTYAMGTTRVVDPDPAWLGYRVTKTILGTHLLAETDQGRLHLNAETGEEWPIPSTDQVETLISDALTARQDRYGRVERVEDTKITTTTGVQISLNWQNLSLYQSGKDTRYIDAIYKIHYLQWTASPNLNKVMGFAGLALLTALTVSGIYLIIRT